MKKFSSSTFSCTIGLNKVFDENLRYMRLLRSYPSFSQVLLINFRLETDFWKHLTFSTQSDPATPMSSWHKNLYTPCLGCLQFVFMTLMFEQIRRYTQTRTLTDIFGGFFFGVLAWPTNVSILSFTVKPNPSSRLSVPPHSAPHHTSLVLVNTTHVHFHQQGCLNHYIDASQAQA